MKIKDQEEDTGTVRPISNGMKTLYLVRHGESDINVSDMYVDPVSSPLTELGKEQSRRLAARAANISFDVLFASPIERTKQTAEMIAATTGHEIEYHDVFRERSLPMSVVGFPKSDPAASAKSDAAIRSSEGYGEKVEDTETFAELCERADRAIALLESRTEDSALVVGHGYFTRILIARMLFGSAMTPEKFAPLIWGLRTKNTGVSVMRHDPTDKHCPWWMLVWNDHSLLG